MPRISLLILASILVGCGAVPSEQIEDTRTSAAEISPSPSLRDIIGRWDVSLYYSDEAAPSKTEMIITGEESGSLTGSFYGSAFSEGRATIYNGTIIFTAITSDGTGPYIHSGRLRNGTFHGQTLSQGRDFLMTWTAERGTPTY